MNERRKSPASQDASDDEKGNGNNAAKDFGVIAYQLFETSISVFIPGSIIVCLYGPQLMELLGLQNDHLLDKAMKSSGLVSVFMFLIPAWVSGWFLVVVGYLLPKFILRPGLKTNGRPRNIWFFLWVIIYILACAISNFPEHFTSTVPLVTVIAISAFAFVIIICDIVHRDPKSWWDDLFPSDSPHTTEHEEERRRVSVEWRTKIAAKIMFRSMVIISLFILLARPRNWPRDGQSFWLDFGFLFFSLLGWSLMHLEHLEAVEIMKAKAKQEEESMPKK